MYFDPSEAATCCECAQMWVNILLALFGSYTVVVIGAWGYFFTKNKEAQQVNEWQNAVLTSVVWFQVAQYLTALALTVFLRLQRSTLVIAPAKARWSAVSSQNRFEVGELQLAETEQRNRKRAPKKRPSSRSSRTPVRTDESEHEQREKREVAELDEQVEAIVAAAGLPQEAPAPAEPVPPAEAAAALQQEVRVDLTEQPAQV